MVKKYNLYLDESGDFDKDLSISWKQECLVGGYIVEEEQGFDRSEARNILRAAYLSLYPDNPSISNRDVLEKINHATELKDKKAELNAHILTDLHKKVDFVIFRNSNKTSVVNSSRTYLTILVDGLIQLLSKLIIKNGGDKVILNVLAGSRVDTSKEYESGEKRQYISPEEYTKRIQERLILEKMKRENIYGSESKIVFSCGNDKRDEQLVLCDYVCNFYMTQDAKVFRPEYREGQSYKEYLLSLYDDINIYHLSGNGEDERTLNYLNSCAYDAAIYDVCTGLITKEDNIEAILANVKKLQDRMLENVLLGVSAYMNNIVAVDRNITSSISYLETAENIAKKLKAVGKDVSKFVFDIKLYQLAVYDHRGDLSEMERLFEECKPALKDIILCTENISYSYMFLNRYAVYLFDILAIEEGYGLLEKLKQNFIAYEMILTDLPGIEIEENDIRTEQLGKILGTQTMYAAYMVKNGNLSYDDAIALSDQALFNFRLESDRCRQYQNRANLERAAGHFEESLTNLCKGFKVDSWVDLFNSENSFALYHLSNIIKTFSVNAQHSSVINKMIKKYRNAEDKLFAYVGFPNFITFGNIAKAMQNLSANKELVAKYYRKALTIETDASTMPLFKILTSMIHADYISFLLKNGEAATEEIKVLESVYNELEVSKLPQTLMDVCEELKNVLASNDPAVYEAYAEKRHY